MADDEEEVGEEENAHNLGVWLFLFLYSLLIKYRFF